MRAAAQPGCTAERAVGQKSIMVPKVSSKDTSKVPAPTNSFLVSHQSSGDRCFLFSSYKCSRRCATSSRSGQHEDEASWSTRSWLSLQAQRMSVALQLAAAEEIATEPRLAAASEDAAVA